MHYLPVLLLLATNLLIQKSEAYLYDENPKVARPGPGTPWPKPKVISTSGDMMTLDPSKFTFNTNAGDCEIVRKALERYTDLVFIISTTGKPDPSIRLLFSLYVKIDHFKGSNCQYPSLDADETYSLDVKYLDQTAHLTSKSVWGALKGLETFSQLVFVDESSQTYRIHATTIEDSPRFAYRGILLDTARHFLPISIIKLNIDAMAYNKMNVFHWHIVDDQAFPFESKIYPNLTTLGAYHPALIYTQDDVREIVEYARLRGVRVIPEIDTPAHVGSMDKAFPHIFMPCTKDGGDPGAKEILNPAIENTHEVINEVIKEFRSVFKDDYIHLGMKDINTDCWKSNETIMNFMMNNKMKTVNDLEKNYLDRIIKDADKVKLKTMIWQDPIDNNVKVSKESIIQVWKDSSLDVQMLPWREYAMSIAQTGHNIVVSSCWNLQYISSGVDWQKYYSCDPQSGDSKANSRVIGGEAILWSDYVDETALTSRLWPRASAVAERLWSTADVKDPAEAKFRLDEHRCRMLRRGVTAEPLEAGYCGDFERDLNFVNITFNSLKDGNIRYINSSVNCSKSSARALLTVSSQLMLTCITFLKFM